MLFEQLSELDQNLIEEYIRHYSIDTNPAKEPASLSHVLRIWDSNKENLYHLLGDNLIIHKTITYEKDQDELENELCQALFSQRSPGQTFSSAFYKLVHRGGALESQYQVEHLLNLSYLSINKYTGSPFSFPLPDGKSYKVQTGVKIMRVLGKIAKAYELPGFDEFCLAHSQVLNQRHIGGELHLSIHPLDYMTMSDNNSDWISCMNWVEWGEYRMGTVEMMNSPCIVVAYMTNSHEPFYLFGRGNPHDQWNNKKWRELFIVDKGIITGIKGYPYENNDIERIVSEWIKELAEANLGWHYDDDYITYVQNCSIKEIECKDCKMTHPSISFITYTMYNDFFDRRRYGYFNSTYLNEQLKEKYHNITTVPTYRLVYSGTSECMWCGETEYDGARFENSDCLVCNECATYDYCTCCGNRIADYDDAVLIDGDWYCVSCYEESFSDCDLCGTNAHNDSLYQLQIVDIETNRMLKSQNSIYLCEDCYRDFVENGKIVECWTNIENSYFSNRDIALVWNKLTDQEKKRFGFNPHSSFENNIQNKYYWWRNETPYEEVTNVTFIKEV